MTQKRGLDAEFGNDNPEFQDTQQQDRGFKLSKCSIDDQRLENMFRKVVREETEHAILRHLQSNSRSFPKEAGLPQFRKFKLHIDGQFPRRLYTGNTVEAVEVLLLDAESEQVVTDGPLSSAKVEILVVHGDFKVELLENWTQKEFNENIVLARDGKRPLLIGQCVIALCRGVGFINELCFTDNSSWVRSKRFRLGAKIGQKVAEEDQVREAVSSPFEVKDRRGETYQKHNTPSLEDEVWRLKGIAKDGKICKRLADHQIYKVKDLLQHYQKDQSFLRSVLRVSPKICEEIFGQALLRFSDNLYKSPNDLVPNDMCTEPTESSTLPFAHLHHFSAPVACKDQAEVQMSYAYGWETTHELDQSMALIQDGIIDNNPLVGDLMVGLCDAGQNPTVGYNIAPSSLSVLPAYEQGMLNFPTSNWISFSQSIGEENSGLFLGSNGSSSIQIISSIPDLGACTSQTGGTKAGWSKLRAKWRILVKYGDATLNKGKFPCNA